MEMKIKKEKLKEEIEKKKSGCPPSLNRIVHILSPFCAYIFKASSFIYYTSEHFSFYARLFLKSIYIKRARKTVCSGTPITNIHI